MEDTYLPAFQAGVERGLASGSECCPEAIHHSLIHQTTQLSLLRLAVMCSYNAETYGYGTNGNGTQGGAIPSCANKYIMNDLARDEWGFVSTVVPPGSAPTTPHDHSPIVALRSN
jgi:beta-glucosidase-like glycosyl hydrolase